MVLYVIVFLGFLGLAVVVGFGGHLFAGVRLQAVNLLPRLVIYYREPGITHGR